MDLKFDIETMDLTIKNGDFEIELNPSQQNGGIFLKGKAFNSRYPTLGVGIQRVYNSPTSVLYETLNLWKAQVKSDGANIANWTIDNDGKILTSCNYL